MTTKVNGNIETVGGSFKGSELRSVVSDPSLNDVSRGWIISGKCLPRENSVRIRGVVGWRNGGTAGQNALAFCSQIRLSEVGKINGRGWHLHERRYFIKI